MNIPLQTTKMLAMIDHLKRWQTRSRRMGQNIPVHDHKLTREGGEEKSTFRRRTSALQFSSQPTVVDGTSRCF